MEESEGNNKVLCCVTGASGYIGSWLVSKLLARGYTVHATLRNLEDKSKVGVLKSLPNADDNNLVLFQADVDKPEQLKPAIQGCHYVFHVALPFSSLDATPDKLQGYTESIVAGVRSIGDLCIQCGSVRRLIYTGSVVSLSPINEDGVGFKSSTLDESFWTPTHLSLSNIHSHYMHAYFKVKTLSEKELMRLNEMEDSKLEVVSLACGLVAGDTLLPYVSSSLQVAISQLKGNPASYMGLQFIEELLGTVPLVHVDDVCNAHIFCIENKTSMKGRFLCAATSATIAQLAAYMQQYHSGFKISQEFMGQSRDHGSTSIDNSRLKEMGFDYKYDLKKIIDGSVVCGLRLGAL